MGQHRWDAVIFDYGRVLSHLPTTAEIEEFAQLVGVSEPPFFQLYSDTRDEYDCGRHDCHQHWNRFADSARISLNAYHIARIVDYETRMWLRTNGEVLELAREIRSHGLQTAILSNMPHDLLRHIQATQDWLNDFSVRIWSCEHGTIKPNSAIYELCLDRLSCAPHRALFFDDRPRNVEGALKVGIDAHLFESVEQARTIVNAGLHPDRKTQVSKSR